LTHNLTQDVVEAKGFLGHFDSTVSQPTESKPPTAEELVATSLEGIRPHGCMLLHALV
jgi:hypothetical protein